MPALRVQIPQVEEEDPLLKKIEQTVRAELQRTIRTELHQTISAEFQRVQMSLSDRAPERTG